MSHTGVLVTVVGESLVDIIQDPRTSESQAHPGGSPLNVAVGVSWLGLRTNLVAHFDDDTYGVADTVGAGDSFMAGLISGLAQLGALGAGGRKKLNSLSEDELLIVAAYANRAGAIICSRSGANPPAPELGLLIYQGDAP